MITSSRTALLALVLAVVACTADTPPTPAPTLGSPGPATPRPSPDATGPVSARLADLEVERLEVAAAAVNDMLYVAGGFVPGGVSRVVEIYDPAADTWSRGQDLPIPLHHAMGVNYGGEFTVLGGFTTSGFSVASDRAFRLTEEGWVELPRMPRPRGAGGAVFLSGMLVLVGGQDGSRLVGETDVLVGMHPDLRWRSVAPLPTPRDHLAVVEGDQFVYALGGRTLSIDATLPIVQRYNLAADTWEELPSMPTARGGFGAAFLNGPDARIIAVGGEGPTATAGPDGVFEAIEVYDVADRSWRALSPDLLTARHGIGVAVIDGTMYVAAGGRQRGGSYSSILESLHLS